MAGRGEAVERIGERVLVVQMPVAPQKPRRRPGRRPGKEAELPAELPLSRVTAVFADRRFGDESEAQTWMRDTAGDEERLAETLAEAAGMLNRALHALAVASGDPYIPERHPAHAIAARIGHGMGPELAEGRFSEALPVPVARPRRRRRTDGVEPQARMAAILGGRELPDICETFLLRARTDLEAGRTREAAVGLALSLDLIIGELSGALADPAHELDLDLVRSHRADLETVARNARSRRLSVAEGERVADMLAVCERILRRRRLLRG